MVTVAMTVLPCACGDRLTRVLLGGRAPGPTPPRRVVPPRPPTRPGGGSASRKAGGAWCPRRPATLRRWGGRDLGRGARKDGPAPRGGGLRPGRGCGHAKSAADRRPGTTGSAHRRLRARRYHTGRIFRRPDGGNPESGAVSRTSPRRLPPPSAAPPASPAPGPGRCAADARRGARSGASGSTAGGGDGVVHRARATGVRGPPPRPSLES